MKYKTLWTVISMLLILNMSCTEKKTSNEEQPSTGQPARKQAPGKEITATPKSTVFVIETQKFRIRIDDMGNDKFRYTSWPVNKDMSTQPDLVIENGEMTMEGTMGDKKYTFHNGEYTYECLTNTVGEESSAPVILVISKGDKEIASQDARIVDK